MNELIKIKNENGVLLVTSRQIAEMTSKQHNDVKKRIREISRCFATNIYSSSTYLDSQNREQTSYLLNEKNIKIFIDNIHKSPKIKPLINFYNSEFGNKAELLILKSRFEDSFIEKLEQVLEALECGLSKQKTMANNNYRLDGYIEEFKIAIEYDEKQHLSSTYRLKDSLRQLEIEKELGCTFVRCNYENTDAYNIGLVIKEIIIKRVVG